MKILNIITSILFLILLSWLFFTPICFAATHYVSPSGSATWTDSTNLVTPCSLDTANTNAVAGDVVMLRGGTYTITDEYSAGISPTNSGSAGNVITFQAYTGETPLLISGSPGTDIRGILLSGKKYIKVMGIHFQDFYRWAMLMNYSSYNEISYCKFYNTSVMPSIGVYITGQCNGVFTCPSTHNWIHHNEIYHAGNSGCSEGSDLVKIGSSSAGDDTSNYNTIENNVIYSAGHTLTDSFSRYNVWRNNIGHNEGWKTDPGTCTNTPGVGVPGNGKLGGRSFSISWDGDKYALLEGNRIGYGSMGPNDNGADNLTISASKNIVRYNTMYGADGAGIFFKNKSSSANNRVYNNTLYKNGQWSGSTTGVPPFSSGIQTTLNSTGNQIKNNLFYQNGTAGSYRDWSCSGTGCAVTDQTWDHNWCNTNIDGCSIKSGDPLFVNPDISDMTSLTLPNLNLQSTSPAKDAGSYLTQAYGPGSSSTTLIVYDALYFQDGTWGSDLTRTTGTMQADWIAIGTVDNVVQIKSINYDSNTITLSSPMTWANGAPIWLYKKSDGTQVLYGAAPDMGAHENGEAIATKASPSSSDGGGGGGGSCFIATAAYGSNLDSHVNVLRDFRDRYLLTNTLGRVFVSSYYRYSPSIATYIGKHEALKGAVRFILTPIVYSIEHPYMNIILLILPAGIVVIWRRKKNRFIRLKRTWFHEWP